MHCFKARTETGSEIKKEQRFCAAFFSYLLRSVFLCLAVGNVNAKPYTPDNFNAVVLQRNYPLLSLVSNAETTNVPRLKDVINDATRFVDYGLEHADPRYLAYAQGLLSPWWLDKIGPEELFFLRANIKQHAHDFGAAIDDLSLILKQNSQNVQALLLRANAYRVKGELINSIKDCQHLLLLTDALVTLNCLAQVNIFAKEPTESARQLKQLFNLTKNIAPLLEVEVHTTLAQLYLAAGNLELAEKYYLQALKLRPNSKFLINQYTQLLLQLGQWQLALNFLPPTLNNNNALIQRAIASQALQLPETDALITELKQRFEQAQIRGYLDISKDLAAFFLYLDPHPDKALRYAYLNWQHQKEMSDLRLLLNASKAVNDESITAEIQQWLNENVQTFRLIPSKTAVTL